MTRRMSAILGEYSPAGQGCTRHFSVPPLEYKNSTSYKKYRPNFGLNIQESYGKRPIRSSPAFAQVCIFWLWPPDLGILVKFPPPWSRRSHQHAVHLG